MITKKSSNFEIVYLKVGQKIFSSKNVKHLLKTKKKNNSAFIYKHSNKNYRRIYTIYFDRIIKTGEPIQFNVNSKILKEYENKFGKIKSHKK